MNSDLFKWILGLLGFLLTGISGWMATTLLDVKENTTVHTIKIEAIEESVQEISTNIKTLKVGPSQQVDPNELANKIYLKIMDLDEEIQKK